MKHHPCLVLYAGLLLALLWVNPSMQAAANRKARAAQKQRTEKTTPAAAKEDFQKRVEQEIANLKEDVYTRATWSKLQEVKQQADDTAGHMKVVTFSAGGIGFVIGCVVTFFVARRIGRPDENLKIT